MLSLPLKRKSIKKTKKHRYQQTINGPSLYLSTATSRLICVQSYFDLNAENAKFVKAIVSEVARQRLLNTDLYSLLNNENSCCCYELYRAHLLASILYNWCGPSYETMYRAHLIEWDGAQETPQIEPNHLHLHVVGVTKTGNNVPRGRTQFHIFGIPGQCATITPCRLPGVTTIRTPTCVCSSLPQRSVQTTTLFPLEL